MARENSDSRGPAPTGDPRVDAFLITRADTAQDEQHRARVRKYLWMMSFRVPALLLAALAYVLTDNYWWAIGIIVLSIPLPWVAVLVANDRPARKKGEIQYYRFGPGQTVGPAELTSEPAETPTPPSSNPTIIDVEAVTARPAEPPPGDR